MPIELGTETAAPANERWVGPKKRSILSDEEVEHVKRVTAMQEQRERQLAKETAGEKKTA